MSTRTAVVWVPDWPVVAAALAAGVPSSQPVAVQDARGVVAVGAFARRAGVRRGMRRRQAQEVCPQLHLLPVDELRDARLFEPVAAAAENVVAGIEIARPGLLLLPSDGPARFHGSEDTLVQRLVEEVAEHTGHECQVGIADGVLAAVLAAREHRLVAPGTSRAHLAARPLLDVLHVAMTPERTAQVRQLVDLWDRLGLRRMQDLAALDVGDVAARFGEPGVWVHRLACGEDLRPPARRRLEADVEASCELDPPAQRVDTAAFAARRLAEQVHAELVARTASCSRLRISAVSTDGRERVRVWRADDGALGGLTVARLTDRVRWQLEGWLTDAGRGENAQDGGAGLVRLALAAEDLVDAGAHQDGLWGGARGARLRAARALERVQGLLGADAVLAARLQGGRTLRDRVHLTPWGEDDPLRRGLDAPWPGHLPDPAPTCVLPEKVPVQVLAADRTPVGVDRRLTMSAPPAYVTSTPDATGPAADRSAFVRGWSGPWPVAQRWWRADGERSVYLQVLVDPHGPDRERAAHPCALLLSGAQGRWFVEATYD